MVRIFCLHVFLACAAKALVALIFSLNSASTPKVDPIEITLGSAKLTKVDLLRIALVTSADASLDPGQSLQAQTDLVSSERS